jgi:hypothetical protein
MKEALYNNFGASPIPVDILTILSELAARSFFPAKKKMATP